MKNNPTLPGIAGGRVLEIEVMDEEDDVAAYLDGVATAHLDRMDDTFVESALRRLGARRPRVLDIGTGTGAIPVKMAKLRDDLTIVGVDMAPNMLEQARLRARAAGLSRRVSFRKADTRHLPFADRTFDMVISNSLMHHLPDPAPALDELARVLKPGGAVFIRDLRRPRRDRVARHIARHGRFYKGTMHRLFADSVRAAFTVGEMKTIVGRTRLSGARVGRQMETYLTISSGPRSRRGKAPAGSASPSRDARPRSTRASKRRAAR